MSSSKRTQPFKGWVQKVLPAVYDDSLSYFEMLGKIIKYLNDLGVSVNELIELQENIMDDIKNNIVRSEVVKKLDQMVLDGTLDDIINVEIFNDLNQSINMIGVDIEKFYQSGDTDYTQAFKRAIEQGYAKIYLRPNKDYVINTVTLPNTTLYLKGFNSTLSSPTTLTTGYMFTQSGSGSRLVCEGVMFTGNNNHRVCDANNDSTDGGNYGVIQLLNGKLDSFGSVNISNFAGQGLSTAPIGFIFHHYTDGRMMQLDNVGSGNILTLNNARNPNRREDKGTDFVGTGNFLMCSRTKMIEGNPVLQNPFVITAEAEHLWSVTPGRHLQLKADDGLYGFSFTTQNEHENAFAVINGSQRIFNVGKGKANVNGVLEITKASDVAPAPIKGGIYFNGVHFMACKDGVNWEVLL